VLEAVTGVTRPAAPVFRPLEHPLARAMREARYRFALERIAGGRVLDAGCGARDGPLRLASGSALVVGVDISAEAMTIASVRCPHGRVRYVAMDVQRLAIGDRRFDAVVSFEVLEHVPDVEQYLGEVQRVLTPAGLYVGSTPNRERADFRPNPNHVSELSASEYRALLDTGFDRVEMYGQWPTSVVEGRGLALRRTLTRGDRLGLRRLVPQRVKDRVNRVLFALKSAHLVDGGDYEFDAGRLEGAAVLVVVCTGPKVRR
jgi:SAM-dependent methyltransferase